MGICPSIPWRQGGRDVQTAVSYTVARVMTRAGLKIGLVFDCLTVDDGACALPLLASVIDWLEEEGASAAMADDSMVWAVSAKPDSEGETIGDAIFAIPRAGY